MRGACHRAALRADPLALLPGNADLWHRHCEPRARHKAPSLAVFAMTGALPVLLRPHQIRKPLEQIMRVARAGRGFRVTLHREHRLALELDAAIGAVEQRDMGL